MNLHRSWWLGRHATPTVQCSYCSRFAVFHWTATYPDVLLCDVCLEIYPEAVGPGPGRSKRQINSGSSVDQEQLR